ncbi:hypothetical protein [Paludibacterium paludis]|uniref:Uncharacterized protein n=1 Tax=Paludibacterium paludis TaxID=1225769 RepID=A0A918P6Z2_9NEIS|nr:hypothetical protein [Paludibacterium paludis]GGY24788.1 hypothetical protein GCM10011289_30520 [Paludibacterium paludis]
MLSTVCADEFTKRLGQTCLFECSQGTTLRLTIQAVELRPLARLPRKPAGRTPFVVALVSEEPTVLADAVGRLSFTAPDKPGPALEQVWIGRVIPAGRDPAFAYFQLPFN